jgi:hypothetical protein
MGGGLTASITLGLSGVAGSKLSHSALPSGKNNAAAGPPPNVARESPDSQKLFTAEDEARSPILNEAENDEKVSSVREVVDVVKLVRRDEEAEEEALDVQDDPPSGVIVSNFSANSLMDLEAEGEAKELLRLPVTDDVDDDASNVSSPGLVPLLYFLSSSDQRSSATPTGGIFRGFSVASSLETLAGSLSKPVFVSVGVTDMDLSGVHGLLLLLLPPPLLLPLLLAALVGVEVRLPPSASDLELTDDDGVTADSASSSPMVSLEPLLLVEASMTVMTLPLSKVSLDDILLERESWDVLKCCCEFALLDNLDVMDSNDFLRSAMVKDEEREAGLPMEVMAGRELF